MDLPPAVCNDAQNSLYLQAIPTALAFGGIIYCAYAYCVAIAHLKNYGLTTHRMELLVYPFIMIMINIPWMLLLIYILWTQDFKALYGEASNIVRAVLASQGFWNALVFGFSQKVRLAVMAMCRRKKYYERTLDDSFIQSYVAIESISKGASSDSLPAFVRVNTQNLS